MICPLSVNTAVERHIVIGATVDSMKEACMKENKGFMKENITLGT